MDIQVIFALLLPMILKCFDDDDEGRALKAIRNPSRLQKLVVFWTLRREGVSRSDIKEFQALSSDLTEEEAKELLAVARGQ